MNGLLFKSINEGELFLGEFTEDNTILGFRSIEDMDNTYKTLPHNQFMFVLIEQLITGGVRVIDLIPYAVANDYGRYCTVDDTLIRSKFPSEMSDIIFNTIYSESIKAIKPIH